MIEAAFVAERHELRRQRDAGPSAAITADRPSSSGTPAATSAPKASTRMISVIGSESVSAFLKSSSNAFESALFADAAPNSPTKTRLVRRLHARHRGEHGLDRRLGRGLVPAQLEVHEHGLPSLEICPSLPLAKGDSTS